MQNKKVSILIPVYGVEKYIEKCLETVVNQTYSNLEIIFINDCTKDNSIKIVENYIACRKKNYDKITIINNLVNVGLAATRNNGLKHATGNFIFHLDSDDYLELTAIESLINVQKINDVDIVFSNLRYIYDLNFTKIKELKIENSSKEYLQNILFRKTGLNVVGNLYKNKLFHEIKFIEGLNFGEDYVTLPRLVYLSKRITFFDKPIYNYLKINSNSYTANINAKSISDILKAYEIINMFFKENNSELFIKINNKAFYTLKAQIIKTTKGDKELLNYFKQKIKYYPKKYPNVNTKINNLINFVFDNNTSLCSFIIKKLSK